VWERGGGGGGGGGERGEGVGGGEGGGGARACVHPPFGLPPHCLTSMRSYCWVAG
jgi:hypothetical protein